MSKTVFSKKSSQLQRPRVDRFIPARESFADERRRGSWRYSEQEEETVDIWDVKYQKQKNFRKYFSEAFGLKSVQYEDRIHNVQAWPCEPRKKRYMSSADSILDLPMYSYAPFPELLDWSSSNMLVAALGYTYHMFSWKEQTVVGLGVTDLAVNCCKFDATGYWLLLGAGFGRIEQHDSSRCKRVAHTRCKCSKDMYDCDITTMNYSPTGNSFVTGCSRGFIISFDSHTLTINSWKRLYRSSIRSVKISPDARYVAVTALNSPLVQVLAWPSLEYHSSVDSDWIIKTISWHPWRSALLGVGAMSTGSDTTCEINMFNTPSSQIQGYKLGLNSHYSLDVMLFSHQTGELVLGVWNSNHSFTTTMASSKLLVMSDPSTVVDHSKDDNNGLGRVRTMVFSPNGNKLATATMDEDLIIWNYIPEDKNKKKTKSKKFYTLPMYLDYCEGGFVLR